MNGGDNIELFLGGSGDDFADGNRGNDTGVMGSGNDIFRWDPGDGSDVVEGDSGTDTLDFNGAGANEVMSLSPNGGRSLFLREPANIRMDMDNVERLDLTALGGVDTMRVRRHERYRLPAGRRRPLRPGRWSRRRRPTS